MNIRRLILAIRKRIYLILGKRFVIKRTSHGTFLLDLLNHIDRQIEMTGEYESPQAKHLLFLLKKNGCDTFFDIGAHSGYYSILLSTKQAFEKTAILAFEPDEVNIGQLYANIFLNHLQDKITVHPVALSNESGMISFQPYNDENRGRSRVTLSGSTKVVALPLDDLIEISDQPLGIKIDVEEHELQVIKGMSRLLSKNNCTIQVEIFNNNVEKVTAELKALGYSCEGHIGNDFYFVNVD